MLTAAMLTISLLTQAQIEGTGALFRRLDTFNPAPVDDNRAEYSLVSSVPTGQGGEIYFSNPLTIRQATGNNNDTAFPWGDDYTGRVYGNLQSTATTLTLPGNTKAFYFSIKPAVFDGSVTVIATSYNGYTVSNDIPHVTAGKAVQVGYRVTNVMDNIKTITVTLINSPTPFIGEFLINQCDPYTFTVNASDGGVLTCSHPTLQLTAPAPDYSYTTPGAPLSIYTFTGPNGFYVRQSQRQYNTGNYVSVSAPGTYTVTKEVKGTCTGTGIVTITEDKQPPTNVTLNTDGGTLSCKKTSVTLTAGSTNGTTYAFTGGGRGFSQSGTANTASVTTPGTYFLVVTGSNGCSASVQNILVNAEAAPSADVTQSLVDLYNATGGPNWTRKDNWIVGCNPCGWQGVTCDGNGRVTALNLNNNNLSGTLPASLSVLTSLQSLELGANALTGGIPLGIGNLTALQTLNLSRTQLGGTVPASLGGLTRLQNLLLNESSLSGSLPASLGTLTQLQNLQLYTNQLSGCFPASYTSLCGKSVSFANNPGLPGGGDFAAFCRDGTGGPLVVSQGPRSGTICVGSAFSFSVVARGASSYQWYKLGPGQGQFQRLAEAGPVLSFSSVNSADAGTYQVYINYACGAIQSDYITLTVPQPGTAGCPPANTPPVATANASQTATAGRTFSYTVNTFTDAQTPNSLTYSASLNPANGLSFDAPTRIISGTPGQPGSVSVTITATDPGGLSASTSFTIAVNPRIVSSSPLRVSTLTASPATLLTTETTTLAATVTGGTRPYSYSFTGPGTITPTGNTATVSGLSTGVQTFTVLVSDAGSPTSQTASATLSVTVSAGTPVTTRLVVSSRDPDNGQLNTNTLKPYLQIDNTGSNPIPYSEITLRYWLTLENYSPLLFSINYAQLGSDKVHLKYMPATTANPTATGYIEFSFDAAAGSLGAGQNSGPIQDIINKQDYSYFDQSNDYSYAPVGQYTPNDRITAYRNGILFWGLEPGPVVPLQSVKAYLQNNTGADANTIEAVLSVTNDGNVPINYGDLKVRYYFTQDNNQPLVLSQVGYTALGSANVSAQLVSINPALTNADTYLEVGFSPSLGQLAPGASTDGVTYQIRHADYSGFNQRNDYSYQSTGGMMQNTHVVVFVAGKRAYGTEPTSGARQGIEERGKLTVQVLGNPVTGANISVSVSGAEGQSLRYELIDVSGHRVGERQVEQAGAVDQQSLSVSHQPAGLLLLRVSTPTQSQTVKVLRQ